MVCSLRGDKLMSKRRKHKSKNTSQVNVNKKEEKQQFGDFIVVFFVVVEVVLIVL